MKSSFPRSVHFQMNANHAAGFLRQMANKSQQGILLAALKCYLDQYYERIVQFANQYPPALRPHDQVDPVPVLSDVDTLMAAARRTVSAGWNAFPHMMTHTTVYPLDMVLASIQPYYEIWRRLPSFLDQSNSRSQYQDIKNWFAQQFEFSDHACISEALIRAPKSPWWTSFKAKSADSDWCSMSADTSIRNIEHHPMGWLAGAPVQSTDVVLPTVVLKENSAAVSAQALLNHPHYYVEVGGEPAILIALSDPLANVIERNSQ